MSVWTSARGVSEVGAADAREMNFGSVPPLRHCIPGASATFLTEKKRPTPEKMPADVPSAVGKIANRSQLEKEPAP